MLAKMSGMDDDSVEALREGTPLGEEKLEALRAFTRAVVVNRGWVSVEITQSFLNAGYTQQNILEVILGVSVKVLSNYTNHFANTPLDPFMKGTEWTHPNKRDAS